MSDGPAANASYKDQYHFKGGYRVNPVNIPSLTGADEKDVNTSIKENPYRSNVNIEKNEIVLKPNLSALFKAKGKTHPQGGIDVLLEPESFIFSNDKTLAFNEKDHEMMEFKQGGNFKPEKNTPAEVLKRNIDIEHYNRIVTNLNNKDKDDTTKKSSLRMLQKYVQTLGNLAYIQEQKKGFPQGLPEFSQGTAPVYNPEVKADVMESKQYVKYGGSIENPYRMQAGGYNPFTRNAPPLRSLRLEGYTHPPRGFNRNEWQYDPNTGRWFHQVTTVSNKTQNLSGAPLSGPPMLETPDNQPVTPTMDYYAPVTKIKGPDISTPGNEKWFKENPPGPKVPTVEGDADNGIPINWQFTPWQKFSQGYNLYKLASAKRYDPYRSVYRGTYVDPALVNPEQSVADLQSGYNQYNRSLNTLSPILRNAQAAGAYGQFLNQSPGVRSQYDNTNAGIINQFRGYNAQERSRVNAAQTAADQQYYQQTVIGRQNFDNMKNYLGDQYMNNLIRDVEQNQALAYNLTTLGPKPAYGYDWRTGNFLRNEKNILDVQGSPQADLLANVFNQLLEPSTFRTLAPQTQAALLKSAALKGLPLPVGYQLNQKKGGKVNPYRY